jgi:hypothetical protein
MATRRSIHTRQRRERRACHTTAHHRRRVAARGVPRSRARPAPAWFRTWAKQHPFTQAGFRKWLRTHKQAAVAQHQVRKHKLRSRNLRVTRPHRVCKPDHDPRRKQRTLRHHRLRAAKAR